MTTAQDKTRHTSGPWRVGKHDETLGIYDMAESYRLATIEEWRGEHEVESEANARLIAAAPDLLEALRWFADELPSIIRTHCPLGVPMSASKAHNIACAAIAKAEGREA